MLKNISIRGKLFMLVFIILIPLILLQLFRISHSYKEKIENELDACQDLASSISTMLESYMEELWTQEAIIGRHLLYNIGQSPEEIKSYLKEVRENTPLLKRINWVSAQGIVISSSDNRLIGLDISDRKYIQKIINGEDKTVSDLVTAVAADGEMVIPVGRAVRKDGNLIGIISAVIDVDQLATRLPKSRVSQTSVFGIVDSSGRLIYSGDRVNIPFDERIYPLDSPVWKALNSREVVRTTNRISVIDSSRKIRIDYPIRSLGWDCFIATSFDQLMAKYYRSLLGDILILILITMLSILTALLLGNQILFPLESLRNSASRLMDGDFTVRTNIAGTDEIAVTAQAFDRMAEGISEYDKLKSQVFTNLSHELKTPLNVIYSSLQLVGKYQSTSENDEYRARVDKQIRIMRQNCYRLMRLINNMIDIQRYDTGFLNIRLSNNDIVKVVEEITLSVVRFIETKGITILFDTDMEEKVMSCDPDMIERIILNLISNAMKFTERGSILVGVYDHGTSVLIIVKDSGIGIPKEKLDIIFERFRQVDDTLQRNQEGSGIGLSLVKALVEAHKGKITVSSELGKGTEFVIELPVSMLSAQESNTKRNETGKDLVEKANIEFSDIYTNFKDQ